MTLLKRPTNPTSGADPDGFYGDDLIKLLDLVELGPRIKKSGYLTPCSTTAATNFSGLLAGASTTAAGGITLPAYSATNGQALRLASSGATGNYAGWDHAQLMYSRGNNCYFALKFQTSRTDIRQFAGFVSSGSTLVGDDPLNVREGIIVGKITTNANWRIAHNDNAGATNFIDTGVAVETTSPHTIVLVADTDNNRFGWSFDGSTMTYITTNIPASGTAMRVENYIDPRSANVVNYDQFWAFTTNDK